MTWYNYNWTDKVNILQLLELGAFIPRKRGDSVFNIVTIFYILGFTVSLS